VRQRQLPPFASDLKAQLCCRTPRRRRLREYASCKLAKRSQCSLGGGAGTCRNDI
jgi:hypothetical protein